MSLHLSTAYDILYNDPVQPGGYGDGLPLVANDYKTWISDVGVSWSMTQHLTSYAYAVYMSRTSGNPELAFTR